MPDFSDAKVDDRVYSMKFGWGTIEKFSPSTNRIFVVFDNGNAESYFFNGYFVYSPNREFRDLYWDVPEISDPPKPKRMIKATRWLNIYKKYHFDVYSSESALYLCKEDAIKSKITFDNSFYVTTIPIEFEVEE